MTNFNESIDINIFMALQISKKCMELGETIPNILLMSNIGVGKSTAISYFAEINDYDLVLLRISNETPDTITGYDIAANADNAETTAAKHIRPSWFQKILDNKKKGKKSLLFLDELTTADTATQGASLNLVFDRRCHAEYLPEDTLVVAAGNYANNLSSEMTVLAPMLNRFIVYNIMPTQKDLKHFMCKYEGSLVGKRMNFKDEIKKAMQALKDQEMKNPSQKFINCVGEYIQSGLYTEAMQQMKEGVLDPKVTELKDIYSNTEGDEPLPNIFSFRSINYLLDAAVACYICFGKEGLLSDNFKNIIHGTVGLALSRDQKTGDIKRTIVTERYYDILSDVANDIEKMLNDRLPEYQSFFNNIVGDDGSVITVANMNLMANKLKELREDKDLAKIDRPIDSAVITRLAKNISTTIKKQIEYTVSSGTNFIDIIIEKPEEYVDRVNVWNNLVGLVSELNAIVTDPKKKYSQEVRSVIDNTKLSCRQCNSYLKMIKKGLLKKDPAMGNTIDIKSF